MRDLDAYEGCATRSADDGEQLVATAGRTGGWLVVEWPGPWGPDPLRAPDAGPVARSLADRAADLGLRLTLARRHDRLHDGRRVFLVWTGPGRPWGEQATLAGLDALLDADLAGLARGRRPGFGRPLDGPVFLVCTHGRKDPCCARFGRPAFRALSSALQGQVWESTHVGGDRFAANLVCLPHGLYFGRVGPSDALRIADAYRQGRIDLPHYRGRPCYPAAVQAAEHHVRRLESLDALDALWVEEHRGLASGRHRVVLRSADHRYRLDLEVRRAEEPRTLVCSTSDPGRPPVWRMLDLLRSPAVTGAPTHPVRRRPDPPWAGAGGTRPHRPRGR